MSTFGAFSVVRSTVKRVLNSSGVLAEVAINTPAFEFNSDGTYRGLLVEPAATNQIRNNTMQGAVVGTPGTLPTNWTESLGGLTREVVAIGSENGVDYIDIRLSGTASATFADIRFESPNVIVATPSQAWTSSFYVKQIASVLPPVSYRNMVFSLAGGAFVAETGLTITPTATLVRSVFPATLNSGGTVTRTNSMIRAVIVSGQSYDFTIRIGLPQMEQSAVATSVIKTSGSTANRTADSVTLTGASSLIGQSEGTVFVEHQPILSTGTVGRQVIAISDNTSTNRVRLIYASFGSPLRYRLISTVTQGGSATYELSEGNAGGLTTGNVEKIAIAYKNADYATYRNGVAVVGTDTGSGTLTSIASSEIDLGQAQNDTLQLNGWIRSVALFPTRLSNAQLQALTT